MRRSMVETGKPASPRCWPYVAGSGVCDEISPQPSIRDSEPWRTYAEMLWSAALPLPVVQDIYDWNRNNRLMMRLGVLSGTGSDCCGNSLMSFTSHGWGFGLLRNDDARAYLLNLYTMSCHSQVSFSTWNFHVLRISCSEKGSRAVAKKHAAAPRTLALLPSTRALSASNKMCTDSPADTWHLDSSRRGRHHGWRHALRTTFAACNAAISQVGICVCSAR